MGGRERERGPGRSCVRGGELRPAVAEGAAAAMSSIGTGVSTARPVGSGGDGRPVGWASSGPGPGPEPLLSHCGPLGRGNGGERGRGGRECRCVPALFRTRGYGTGPGEGGLGEPPWWPWGRPPPRAGRLRAPACCRLPPRAWAPSGGGGGGCVFGFGRGSLGRRWWRSCALLPLVLSHSSALCAVLGLQGGSPPLGF